MKQVAKLGEYGGNDAIVAYARAEHVDIFVHQVSRDTERHVNVEEARELATLEEAYDSTSFPHCLLAKCC